MRVATEPAAVLGYIRDAADLIFQFTEGNTFPQYEQDAMLRSAVERQFITIGESVNLFSMSEPELVSRITNYHRTIGLRNHLAHVFFAIDNGIVWRAITYHLPILHREVTELIREYEEH